MKLDQFLNQNKKTAGYTESIGLEDLKRKVYSPKELNKKLIEKFRPLYKRYYEWLYSRTEGWIEHFNTEIKHDYVYWILHGDNTLSTLYNKQHIYIVYSPRTKTIKIGRSKNLIQRLQTLKGTFAPDLEILGITIADKQLEKDLHSVFVKHRVGGEFFKDCKEIKQFAKKYMSLNMDATWKGCG